MDGKRSKSKMKMVKMYCRSIVEVLCNQEL